MEGENGAIGDGSEEERPGGPADGEPGEIRPAAVRIVGESKFFRRSITDDQLRGRCGHLSRHC